VKELVERRVVDYAIENGMSRSLNVSEPKQEYFGWTVIVSDDQGRVASVRFTKEGSPSMWEMYKQGSG
jgi:hypothetical protein